MKNKKLLCRIRGQKGIFLSKVIELIEQNFITFYMEKMYVVGDREAIQVVEFVDEAENQRNQIFDCNLVGCPVTAPYEYARLKV